MPTVWWPRGPSRRACPQRCCVWSGCRWAVPPRRNLPASPLLAQTAARWQLWRGSTHGRLMWSSSEDTLSEKLCHIFRHFCRCRLSASPINNQGITVRGLLANCGSVHLNSPLKYKLYNEWNREWMSIPLTCYVIFVCAHWCHLVSWNLRPLLAALSQSATFDIPVDLLLRVQILQPLEDLSQDRGDLGLIQSAGLHLSKRNKQDNNKAWAVGVSWASGVQRTADRREVFPFISDSDSILGGWLFIRQSWQWSSSY